MSVGAQRDDARYIGAGVSGNWEALELGARTELSLLQEHGIP